MMAAFSLATSLVGEGSGAAAEPATSEDGVELDEWGLPIEDDPEPELDPPLGSWPPDDGSLDTEPQAPAWPAARSASSSWRCIGVHDGRLGWGRRPQRARR